MANYEIERKWSITSDNGRPLINAVFKEDHIVYQWYLVADKDSQVRVSKREEEYGDRYTLNIKMGNGLTRKEVKIDIDYKEFLALIAQCDPELAPIKKHLFAYYLPDDRILEVSKVDDKWWYAEVEFESEDQAVTFDIEQYLHKNTHALDQTNVPDYAMKNYWRRTRLGI